MDNNVQIKKDLKVIDTARRHVIKLNNIVAYKPTYNKSTLRSRDLVTTPIKNIAIYCNEYIPDNLPDEEKYITYILTINGTDHEIVPINSQRNGKKIIRALKTDMPSDYVIYINESIKSAYLTIVINSSNKEFTPYISDLKILAGGNE